MDGSGQLRCPVTVLAHARNVSGSLFAPWPASQYISESTLSPSPCRPAARLLMMIGAVSVSLVPTRRK